jgi:hypothetical protein
MGFSGQGFLLLTRIIDGPLAAKFLMMLGWYRTHKHFPKIKEKLQALFDIERNPSFQL